MLPFSSMSPSSKILPPKILNRPLAEKGGDTIAGPIVEGDRLGRHRQLLCADSHGPYRHDVFSQDALLTDRAGNRPPLSNHVRTFR